MTAGIVWPVTWGIAKRIAASLAGSDLAMSHRVGTICMKSSRQTTLRSQATVTGVGVHSGLPVSLTLGPASIDAGFIFVRSGPDGSLRQVSAAARSVTSTEFATVLGDRPV